MCYLLSCVRLFVILLTVIQQAPVSRKFFRQEYWSGLLFLPPGRLPDPELEPWSPALQADSLLSELTGKDLKKWSTSKKKKNLKRTPKIPIIFHPCYSIYMYAYMSVCVCVCVCIYIYIYIYIKQHGLPPKCVGRIKASD